MTIPSIVVNIIYYASAVLYIFGVRALEARRVWVFALESDLFLDLSLIF